MFTPFSAITFTRPSSENIPPLDSLSGSIVIVRSSEPRKFSTEFITRPAVSAGSVMSPRFREVHTLSASGRFPQANRAALSAPTEAPDTAAVYLSSPRSLSACQTPI